ncbi:MAG: hypothetical protein HY763_08660 [Planctomycetes bacterium]|nr:hypothetical protein [Planctomycetota bacterium]
MSRPTTPTRRTRAPGYTLVELSLSMAATALIMTGLASAMVLTTRAIPTGKTAVEAQTQAFHAAEEIAADLYCARSFTVRTALAAEFTVADRTGDASPDTIRYEWSGVAGAPVMRRFNNDAATEFLSDVREFSLTYGLRSVDETTTQQSSSTSAETVLGYFDGWAGITPTSQSQSVSDVAWISEYFTVAPPANTTAITFTRARMSMKRGISVPTLGYIMELRRSQGSGSYYPAALPLLTSAAIAPGTLGTSFQWVTATFSGTPITDLSRNDFCLVLKGLGAIGISAENFYSASAPADSTVGTWTSTAGASWTPTKNFHNQDFRFYVYGTYTTQTTNTVTVTRSWLDSVRMMVRAGSDAAARIDTDVQVLNGPEVTGL